jgi:hypothetical protein
MNRLQKILPGLSLLLALGFVSSQTFAISCFSLPRPFPSVAPALDSVNLSCDNNTVKGTHVAEIKNSGGFAVKSVSALLTLGNLVRHEAITFGIDFNGQPMTSCAILDGGPANASGKTDATGCGPAVQWRARINT